MPSLVEKLTAIGNAIRAKTGGSDMLTLDEMPDEIAGIKSGGFDFSQIKTTSNGSTQYVFYNNETITLDGADFSQVTTAKSMFSSCTNLTSVDLTPLAGAPITNTQGMFFFCSRLTSIDLTPLAGAPITNTSSMFSSCTNLTSVDLTPLAGLDSLNLYMMFKDCTSLTSVLLDGLENTPISSLNQAFYRCTSITHLDLSALDTSTMSTAQAMISGCTSLQELKTGENWTQQSISSDNNKGKFPVAMQDENSTQFAVGDVIPDGAHTYTAVN